MNLCYLFMFSVISVSQVFASSKNLEKSALTAHEDFDEDALFEQGEEIDLSSLFSIGEVKGSSSDKKSQVVVMTDDTNRNSSSQMTTTAAPIKTTPAVANQPINPPLANGTGIFATGEMLIFQAAEDGLSYAYQGQAIDTQHYRNAVTPQFNWNLGFRVGLGYDTPYDGWDINLVWMELQNHASGSTNFTNATGYQIWTVTTTIVPGSNPSASSSLKIDLDQVDLTLGRAFQLSPNLILRPNMGLRSDWIFQRYNVYYNTSAAGQKASMAQRFFSFGFSGGLSSNWTFPYGMSLFGNVGMSAGLGFFSLHQQGFDSGVLIWNLENSFRTVKPVFDFALGFQWDNCCIQKLTNDRLGMTLRASYEYHLYLNQNQFMVSSGSPYLETFNSQKGDLGYQGVSIALVLQF